MYFIFQLKDLYITTDSLIDQKIVYFIDRIGFFMDIFSYEIARRIGDQNVFEVVPILKENVVC